MEINNLKNNELNNEQMNIFIKNIEDKIKELFINYNEETNESFNDIIKITQKIDNFKENRKEYPLLSIETIELIENIRIKIFSSLLNKNLSVENFKQLLTLQKITSKIIENILKKAFEKKFNSEIINDLFCIAFKNPFMPKELTFNFLKNEQAKNSNNINTKYLNIISGNSNLLNTKEIIEFIFKNPTITSIIIENILGLLKNIDSNILKYIAIKINKMTELEQNSQEIIQVAKKIVLHEKISKEVVLILLDCSTIKYNG
jgi:hypothetical protein